MRNTYLHNMYTVIIGLARERVYVMLVWVAFLPHKLHVHTKIYYAISVGLYITAYAYKMSNANSRNRGKVSMSELL